MPTSFLMRTLRELQSQSNETDYEIAKRAGVSQTYLAQLRDGTNVDPSLSKIVRISIAYGVSIDRFVDPDLTKLTKEVVKARMEKKGPKGVSLAGKPKGQSTKKKPNRRKLSH